MGRPIVRDHELGFDRIRVLLGVAFGPIVIGYAVVASLLVVVVALAPRADFSAEGVLFAACPAWLAAYQAPLDIDGAPLGVLPLLPTFAVVLAVFRASMAASYRLDHLDGGQAGVVLRALPVMGAVAGAHALTAVAFVGISVGTSVEAQFPEAIVMPTVVSVVAALVGAATASSDEWLHRLDPVAVRGIRAGLVAFGVLMGLGALAYVGATLAAWSTLETLFEAFSPDPGSAVGMVLLSTAYVPNAAVLAASVLTGGGFVIGSVSVSAFAMDPGPLPALPVLAGLPAEYGSWWPLLLVLPLALGAAVGWSLRDVDERVVVRLRAVLVAGVVCGFCALVVAAVTGGELGGGAYDPVSVRAEVFSLTAFAFVAGPGAVVAWLTGAKSDSRRTPRKRQRARRP
ncbi:DUF6350 family protein [Saccharomonospora sp. NB11]|jgi:hypothetical protein|uniref:cell division protein PerM n=1 Tax=Saccharomonospora sp. NB11 TaxID=1642298 RepID=UPI0018D1DB28|nr:DUF6350 family protein [Saccharomonospora sp. NB11]